ncbi:hypothetical protein CANARDRAFT_26003 [[Candida] arabinofermentans NRRL YB-2248]|uniref:Uncharacterized protein n=1 Tax=[Candida] arabinofermentans NRRL YB-2248 TaxID=983967 RepID=A0A1E4T7S6_9ASCO|nr:hypothetical protein CANARDRAFT_26003 [[Candida] arabinofermentans NRRL YB-2248]
MKFVVGLLQVLVELVEAVSRFQVREVVDVTTVYWALESTMNHDRGASVVMANLGVDVDEEVSVGSCGME